MTIMYHPIQEDLGFGKLPTEEKWERRNKDKKKDKKKDLRRKDVSTYDLELESTRE